MDIIPDGGEGFIEDISGFFGGRANVCMLRLDRLHAVVSGNKWFKLKLNLEAALDAHHQQILTFGGAYSNHLVATAAAAQAAGIASIGIVRGLTGDTSLTPTLAACASYGMRLHFFSHADYARKEDPAFLESLQVQFGRSYMIPEGGNNDPGRKGVEAIASLIPEGATTVCLPVGTGTTFAGLRNALPPSVTLMGFTAMKGGEYLVPQISAHLHHPEPASWKLQTAWAGRGFARTTPAQIDFMRCFYQATGIPLDIVYTGKMMMGVQELIAQGAFAEGEKICCIHTGGLQGNPPDLYV